MGNTDAIYAIIAKQAKTEPTTLKPETQLSNLDLQSIDIVELVFAIEDTFDIEIPYAPSEQNTAGISFKTVGDIVAAVEKLVGEQHPDKA